MVIGANYDDTPEQLLKHTTFKEVFNEGIINSALEVLKKFTSKEAQPSFTDAIKSISDTPDKTVSILILFWQLLLSIIVSVGLNVPLSLYV